jgi:hypothetical protein
MQVIIARKIKSLYIQNLMQRRGWSADYVRVLLVEFVTCGRDVSLFDFMEAQS